MINDNKILVFGNGGLAKQLDYDILKLKLSPVYYEDNNGINIKKYKRFILGISNPKIRQSITSKLVKLGLSPYKLISSFAYISDSCKIEENVTILRECIIEPKTNIGYGSLLNLGVYFHHDSACGKFCEIAPRATILGNVSIGDYTFIGSGAIIKEKTKIGKNCIIGMGSVVIRNIPDGQMWVGNPAKFIKKTEL